MKWYGRSIARVSKPTVFLPFMRTGGIEENLTWQPVFLGFDPSRILPGVASRRPLDVRPTQGDRQREVRRFDRFFECLLSSRFQLVITMRLLSCKSFWGFFFVVQLWFRYSKAISIDPMNHVLYSNRAFAHFRLESFGFCLSDANKAIELNPKFVKVQAHFPVSCIEITFISFSRRIIAGAPLFLQWTNQRKHSTISERWTPVSIASRSL